MAQPDFFYRSPAVGPNNPWPTSTNSLYNEGYRNAAHDARNGQRRPPSVTYSTPATSSYNLPVSVTAGGNGFVDMAYSSPQGFDGRPVPGPSPGRGTSFGASYQTSGPQGWDNSQESFSPFDSVDDMMATRSLSDYSPDNGTGGTSPGRKTSGKGRSQRRPSNRDEFDGPHQFLTPPNPDVLAMQERELPHLPTNLLVQEQDSVLAQVNDRLSQCAYDFVAKYQFPVPLQQDMRPVERPQDREWTEWVYLLKRLATKRRIPARLLYNGQIKQFVTILENSLEMRHAAKHQSRPLKDDRNILQLISAGIQVAKILKDAQAMEYLDRLYVSTELQIQERSVTAAARFRP